MDICIFSISQRTKLYLNPIEKQEIFFIFYAKLFSKLKIHIYKNKNLFYFDFKHYWKTTKTFFKLKICRNVLDQYSIILIY